MLIFFWELELHRRHWGTCFKIGNCALIRCNKVFYYKNSCIINMRELSALLTILIIVNILQDPAETHHIQTLFPHTLIHGIFLDKLPCLYVFSLTKHKWDTAPTRIVQKPICTIIRICSGLINRKPREMLCTWERD